MRRTKLAVLCPVLGVASAVMAGGDMTDGNARFRIGVSNFIGSFAIPFSAPNGEGELITDTGGSDQIARNLWYFRSEQQGTGLLPRVNTPSESYMGNMGINRYTQAAGSRYFAYNDPVATGNILNPQVYIDLTYTAKLQDFAAANTVKIVQRIDVTNNNTFPVAFKLYNLLGPSLGGPGAVSNDVVSFNGGDPTDIRFADGIDVWQFKGFGASRGQAGEARSSGLYGLFPTSLLSTTALVNLSNGVQGGGSSFGNSIFGVAGALQFDFNLAPGASATIYSIIGVNTAATIPVSCFVDYNNDGFLNQEDLSGYLTAFLDESVPPGPSGTGTSPCPGAPSPYNTLGYAADFNRDCNFDQEDLSGFITEYFSQSESPNGCILG